MLYFMPTVLDERGRLVPKHASSLRPFGCSMMENGAHDHALVHSDCDAATDALVSADPDVLRIPENLDAVVTPAEAGEIAGHLTANALPVSWLSAGVTWRQLVRRICAYAQFSQRHRGLNGKHHALAGKGQLRELTPAQRTELHAALTSMSREHPGRWKYALARDSMTGTNGIEAVITAIADAWDEPMHLQGVAI